MEVYVSLDRTPYREKPLKEIVAIKRRAAAGWTRIGVAELAELAGNRGCSIVPGHMQGGLKAENCTGMQLLVLDFDGGVTFGEVSGRCRRLGLPITFAYHTFSSTAQQEKFRVAFAYAQLLEDTFVIRAALAMLHRIFPECDQGCKNLDRLFLGGKGLLCLDEDARINLVQLLIPFYQSVDSGGNFKRNILGFCKKQGILLVDGLPAVGPEREWEEWRKIDGIVDSAIIHKIEGSMEPSIFILEMKKREVLHQYNTCREKRRRLGITGDVACQLLDDFNSGVHLDHNTRFALCTNLMCINGGQKHFLDILGKYYEKGVDEKWKACMRYMRNYHPQNCSEGSCPYFRACGNAGSIVNRLEMDRRVYREGGGEETYPKEEAREHMRGNLETAYRSARQGIHLIKAQTGLGKTYAYTQLIKEHPEDKFLVALPTNMLKEQVAKDILARTGEEAFVTKSVRENMFIPSRIQEEIEQAHQQGFHNRTNEIIKGYLEEIKGMQDKPAVAEECQKILEGVKAIKEERVVVTTHAFMMTLPEEFLRQYTVIIDEDILMLQVMCRASTVSEGCLQALLRLGNPEYARIAGEMLGAREGEYRRVAGSPFAPAFSEGELEGAGMSQDDNINDIALAAAFVRKGGRVNYFCPQKLPGLKYIILSATLNEGVYREYFKGRMDVWAYPEKKAAYKGRLVQYTYHSLGRSDLGKKMEAVAGFIRERKEALAPRSLNLISFMCRKQELLEAAGLPGARLHFGNTCGINSLSGQDLIIVGTPYKAEEAYKLAACCLGADVNREVDRQPRPRRVSYNGYSFLITTYDEPLLRELQLYSLESELEQCIGRARLLNNGCVAYVLSAFPCEQAELHMEDYLKVKK